MQHHPVQISIIINSVRIFGKKSNLIAYASVK